MFFIFGHNTLSLPIVAMEEPYVRFVFIEIQLALLIVDAFQRTKSCECADIPRSKDLLVLEQKPSR